MPFVLFDTVLGPCGIAWSERGITQVQLPMASPGETRDRIAGLSGDDDGERDGAAAPPWVRDAMLTIVRHLEGVPQDMRAMRLDLSALPPFYRRVYEESR